MLEKEIKYIYLFFLIFYSLSVNGQHRKIIGGIPEILFQKNIADNIEVFNKIGSEIFFTEKINSINENTNEVINIDFQPGISIDLNPNLNLAGAFTLRLRNPFSGNLTSELRPMQQITLIHRIEKYRIRNRLRAEQRWIKRNENENHAFDFRARYRLSLDFPLQGERLDNQEFYLNSSHELLLTTTFDDMWFFRDNRSYLGIGNKINEKNKLELGLERRIRNRNSEGDDDHRINIKAVWVVNI